MKVDVCEHGTHEGNRLSPYVCWVVAAAMIPETEVAGHAPTNYKRRIRDNGQCSTAIRSKKGYVLHHHRPNLVDPRLFHPQISSSIGHTAVNENSHLVHAFSSPLLIHWVQGTSPVQSIFLLEWFDSVSPNPFLKCTSSTFCRRRSSPQSYPRIHEVSPRCCCYHQHA